MALSRVKFIFLIGLLATALLSGCGGAYNAVKKSSDTQAKYNAALAYYKAGQYVKALPLFEELVSIYRGTDKAEDLYYYYAYCNYYLQDYVMAQFYFTNYYRTYPHTARAEECEFMRAYCSYLLSPVYSLDQTDTKKAIEAFQTFVDDNPNSSRIKEANKDIDLLRSKLEKKYFEIAKQYYVTEFYASATVAMNNYLKDYPDSKYAEQAYLIMVKADYKYAVNSVLRQKPGRLQKVIDDYTKFANSYPKSEYLKEAENLSKDAKSIKENLHS
jgi:outer membrane protein assembly factor BamD